MPLAQPFRVPYPAGMRLFRTISFVAPLAITALAAAQEEAPPTPLFAPTTNPVIGYLIGAVLFGIIVAVSLMPSKRSHQDL
jgi:hypothetical protein